MRQPYLKTFFLVLLFLSVNAVAESQQVPIEARIVHDDSPDCLVVTLPYALIQLENNCEHTVTVSPVPDACKECSESTDIKPGATDTLWQGIEGSTNKYRWRIETTSQEGGIEVEWHYYEPDAEHAGHSHHEDSTDDGGCSAGPQAGQGWLSVLFVVLCIGFMRRRCLPGQSLGDLKKY